MVRLDLSKGTTIYYDIENKIIGRKPSPSNLKEQGSDNSIYLGIVGNYSDEILCSIFEIEDINEFSFRDYKMNFYGNEVDISCNINNGKQIQIKVNGDGHMYKLLSKYKNNINPNDAETNKTENKTNLSNEIKNNLSNNINRNTTNTITNIMKNTITNKLK